MTRLRPTALLALLGMSWAALLPFTAAAHLLLSGEHGPYCHNLSVMLEGGDESGAPQSPAKAPKGQCPFCSTGIGAAPSTPLPVPCFVAAGHGAAAGPHCAAIPYGIEVEIPRSRAPPGAGRM